MKFFLSRQSFTGSSSSSFYVEHPISEGIYLSLEEILGFIGSGFLSLREIKDYGGRSLMDAIDFSKVLHDEDAAVCREIEEEEEEKQCDKRCESRM